MVTVSGEMNVARCPKCHALDVRASRARLSDFWALVLFRKIARCGTCKNRFSTWSLVPADREPAAKDKGRKKMRVRTRVKVREKFLNGNE